MNAAARDAQVEVVDRDVLAEALADAFEDQCGAGAIIRWIAEDRTPKARSAVAVYQDARADLYRRLRDCESGCEKRVRGLERDIELAAAVNVSASVPRLLDGAYVG